MTTKARIFSTCEVETLQIPIPQLIKCVFIACWCRIGVPQLIKRVFIKCVSLLSVSLLRVDVEYVLMNDTVSLFQFTLRATVAIIIIS